MNSHFWFDTEINNDRERAEYKKPIRQKALCDWDPVF